MTTSNTVAVSTRLIALGRTKYSKLAKLTELNPSYIRRVFAGKISPSLTSIRLLAVALGVSIDALSEYLPDTTRKTPASGQKHRRYSPMEENDCKKIINLYVEGIRTGNKRTCRDLATEFGCSRSTVSNILRRPDAIQQIKATSEEENKNALAS